MTIPRQYQLAIIGCGGVADMHLEAYHRHRDRVTVNALCDPEVEKARTQADRWEVPLVHASIDELIEKTPFDIAVVCTPTPVRENLVETLAAAGRSLFVEKPLADSLAEAMNIVQACKDAGVLLAVDQNFRYHYPFDQARTLLAEGRIGRPFSVLHQDLFFRQDRGWRTRLPRHALSVMGIHWLDGFRWMLNSEALWLSCHAYSSAAIDSVGETDASVQIGFADGVVVTYVQSFSSPLYRTETVILGEKGVLTMDYRGIALRTPRTPEPMERWSNPYAGPEKPESTFHSLEHLLLALDAGASPPNSGQDNLKSVELLETAYISAQEGRPISLPLSARKRTSR